MVGSTAFLSSLLLPLLILPPFCQSRSFLFSSREIFAQFRENSATSQAAVSISLAFFISRLIGSNFHGVVSHTPSIGFSSKLTLAGCFGANLQAQARRSLKITSLKPLHANSRNYTLFAVRVYRHTPVEPSSILIFGRVLLCEVRSSKVSSPEIHLSKELLSSVLSFELIGIHIVSNLICSTIICSTLFFSSPSKYLHLKCFPLK